MSKILSKKKYLISLILLLGILIPLSSFSISKIEDIKENKILVQKIKNNEKYYAIIEIPKIKLQKELNEITDKKNDVNKNILVHKNSKFPDNIILASHSGNNKHAYFKNLYKLKINDHIKIYYDNKIYEYTIQKIEEQNKTGKLYLENQLNERLILITCSQNNKNQVIYYSKLTSISDI